MISTSKETAVRGRRSAPPSTVYLRFKHINYG